MRVLLTSGRHPQALVRILLRTRLWQRVPAARLWGTGSAGARAAIRTGRARRPMRGAWPWVRPPWPGGRVRPPAAFSTGASRRAGRRDQAALGDAKRQPRFLPASNKIYDYSVIVGGGLPHGRRERLVGGAPWPHAYPTTQPRDVAPCPAHLSAFLRRRPPARTIRSDPAPPRPAARLSSRSRRSAAVDGCCSGGWLPSSTRGPGCWAW